MTHIAQRERNRLRGVKPARVLPLLLATCALASVVACTADGADSKEPKASGTTPASSPSSPPSATADPVDPAKAEVLAAYDRYWREVTASYAKADSQGTGLKSVASGAAYASVEGSLTDLRTAGRVATGQPQHTSEAVQFKQDTKLKTAVLTSCVDITQWKMIDKETKQEVVLPEARLTRYVTTTTAELWPAGWVIIQETPEKRSC